MKPREIIAVDCETTPHGIVLFLSAGEQSPARFLYRASGLDYREVLDWLTSLPHGPLYCGFFFDYDVNQIIRFLPPLHQEQLAAQGRVSYRGFRIRHIPSKRFTVENLSTKRRITIWDVGGWAQCSFSTLCEREQLGTARERAYVAAMKAKRGSFITESRAALIRYTTLECRLLSQWVQRLIQLHEDCGIHLRSYTGGGATAAALLRGRGWKAPALPPHIEYLAQASYFGGRSEISCNGPVPGPVYAYDINSAYPSAICSLPEIGDACWVKVSSFQPAMWGFYHVEWEIPASSPWGPFPVRGGKSSSLIYPVKGSGYYHSWEIEAALEVFGAHAIRVKGGYAMIPSEFPFTWVRDLARMRLFFKAANDPRAFPLKVGLNSLYGKMAQRAGKAPLRCLAYAAAITARTRGQLLRVAARHGHVIRLLATDGIISSSRLDLELGCGLGQWGEKEYDSAWILQSGVYWLGSKQKSRGFEARALDLDTVRDVWRQRGPRGWVKVKSRRVMSYRQAAQWKRTSETGGWMEGERLVSLTPSPRRKEWKWDGPLLLTLPETQTKFEKLAVFDEIFKNALSNEMEAAPEWQME